MASDTKFCAFLSLSRFPEGELNACYNAVDRHVENGYEHETAVIYDSPVTKTIQSFSYKKLQESVSFSSKELNFLSCGSSTFS